MAKGLLLATYPGVIPIEAMLKMLSNSNIEGREGHQVTQTSASDLIHDVLVELALTGHSSPVYFSSL